MTKRNLKEVVYQRLKKWIISHEVLPGMRLREEELALREKDLSARESEVLQKEEILVDREKSLVDEEKSLKDDTKAFDDRRRRLEQESLQFRSMPPENAVKKNLLPVESCIGKRI